MSERDINQSVRYSDPLTERGGWVGRGAVLYDVRDAAHRTCCAKDRKRHLYHITAIYEEIETGGVLVEVQDGTHTVCEMIHLDDVLGLFKPAGFRIPVGTKPTYVLTRQHGVKDGHDLMTDGGRSSGGTERCPNCQITGTPSHSAAEIQSDRHEYNCINESCRVSLYYVDADTDRSEGGGCR